MIPIKDNNKNTDKFKSLDLRKILSNNTKIVCKNSNKNHLQIQEAITIRIKKKLPKIKQHSPRI